MPSLDDPNVQRRRAAQGGQLQPMTWSQSRWYLADIETAQLMADGGDLSMAAQLMRAAMGDGIVSGVMSTRTGGLVRLPKRFRGEKAVIDALEVGHDSVRSVFDEMFPASELSLLAADGVGLGVGVGELVPVEGRSHPALVRLSPEFLRFRWNENRWYYASVVGLLPITPGDGRWILHIPGGRNTPWQTGLWRALGRAFIRKEHSLLFKDNWERVLANPARVAISPTGAGEEQSEAWFRQVLAWGLNSVFGMRPGYDVKLVESNGKGFESFNTTIADQNGEIITCIAGQTVTTDGGAGFANADIHKSIRADLITADADALAFTINTQGLPSWIATTFGEEMLATGAVVSWDASPAKDRNSEATAMVGAANAVKGLAEAFAGSARVDVNEIASRFNIPLLPGEKAPATKPEQLTIDPAVISRQPVGQA